MSSSGESSWQLDLFEAAPSIAFALILQSSGDLELAGWVGAAFAAGVLVGFWVRRMPPSPIFVGINLHLAIITPLIVGLNRLQMTQIANRIEANSYTAVLLTIFITGCALTLFSRGGFIGSQALPRQSIVTWSVVMLVASLASIIWALFAGQSGFLAVGLPIVGLFALRRAILKHAEGGVAQGKR